VASAASPAGWGPDEVPYLHGVVCTSPAGSSALVSWPSAATDAPAFALAAVTADRDGSQAARPALDTARATRLADPALGYLLARHGDANSAAEVADVAAAVLAHRGSDPIAAHCLATGTHGASAARAASLSAEATRLAGPYTVHLAVAMPKLILGEPASVSVVVTAASGAPVPGIAVTFDTAEPSANLSHANAVTDGGGRATTALTVSRGSPARAVRIGAHAAVPGTPIEMTAPGAVSLVAAGPAQHVNRTARVPVDTTADPHLRTGVDRALVLPGTVVRPTISVTGMRGHSGTATLLVRGPLPIRTHSGCAAYRAAPLHAGPTTALAAAAPVVSVTRDATFQTRPMRLARPGCYLLSSELATSDAIPNVRRVGGTQTVAVAPVHLAVTPAGGGVTTGGPISATVTVRGKLPARLTGVQATLLGPRPSDDGSCRGLTYPRVGVAMTPGRRNGVLTMSSPVAAKPGCYGLRVLGTVVLPWLGALSVTEPVSATAFVLAPSASVVGLSASDVTAGGRIKASVTVSGSWTQPGALRLELKHLPYDWRGCFGRDWTHATTAAVSGPLMPTAGDGTYSVVSPAVPSDGCWTVVPVLSLRANPAISVSGAVETDSMTAFTGLPPAERAVAEQTQLRPARSGPRRIVLAGIAMLVLLMFSVTTTLSIALRDR
jgi:hypothetical protein